MSEDNVNHSDRDSAKTVPMRSVVATVRHDASSPGQDKILRIGRKIRELGNVLLAFTVDTAEKSFGFFLTL